MLGNPERVRDMSPCVAAQRRRLHLRQMAAQQRRPTSGAVAGCARKNIFSTFLFTGTGWLLVSGCKTEE